MVQQQGIRQARHEAGVDGSTAERTSAPHEGNEGGRKEQIERRDIYADESCEGFPILSDNIDPKGEYVEWNDIERILRKRESNV